MIKYYTGLSGSGKAYFILEKLAEAKVIVAVAAEDDIQAWHDNLLALGKFFPSVSIYKYLQYDPFESINTLDRLSAGAFPCVVLATPESFALKTVSPDSLKKNTMVFSLGKTSDYEKTLSALSDNGYQREDFVEDRGHFSRRGEILDIWTPDMDSPVRIVFDVNTVETIRSFDVATQRSDKMLKEIRVLPVHPVRSSTASGAGSDGVLAGPASNGAKARAETALADYLPAGAQVYFDAQPSDETASAAGGREILVNSALGAGPVDAGFRPLGRWAGNFPAFISDLKKFREQNYSLMVFCAHQGEKDRLEEILNDNKWRDELPEMHIGPLAESFYSPSRKLAVFSGQEILYRRRPVSFPKFKAGRRLEGLWEITPNDYVVHEKYGVGKYLGLKKIVRGDQEAEYICVEYRGGDKLYVPVDDFRVVQKYIGIEGCRPRLHSLDTAAWERLKKRAKEGAEKMAAELLRLYAERSKVTGTPYAEETAWEKELADSFPYSETEDQLRAIEEVKADLRRAQPMERLICGDVGYGKTEVAIRAAFKVAVAEKQVAVLVPTTVLAEQHYNTFVNRLAPFPVNVAMMSRFQSKKEQKKTVADIKNGLVDIVIGTHRLIQKDISFKDLGLLIIDEEHRFGVKEKEKIKALKKNIEVLLLSATPIPRTLAFALANLRDLSVIETPPAGRLPIETHLGLYDERVVKKIIQAEISRGGQVFYVYNRVETILSRVAYLKKLMPDVKFGIVHGQLPAAQIEKAMWDFMHRKIDVLVASTIIESGLDIPSANTMVVEEAENFGLAQLYQLRGRIGREKQKAYCYLFYTKSLLKSDAEKRLESLQEFGELGSGFRLSLRDLEIRGAGNILGREQHGFVREIGFELYSRLIEEASKGIKGERPEPEEEFKATMDFSVPALFPPEYMESEELRIIFYRKLAAVASAPEFDAVRDELEDRFGRIPDPAENLFRIAELRVIAEKLKIKGISEKQDHFEVYFSDRIGFTAEKIAALARDFSETLEFIRGEQQGVRLKKEKPAQNAFEYLKRFLLKFKEYVIIPKY
ncbi:MAG: transcription-repair coupling factor [Elusimicrobiota bacterium]